MFLLYVTNIRAQVLSRGPMRRFHDISETSAKGVHLLDEMYQRILADIMPKHMHEEAIPIFRSVMGCIVGTTSHQCVEHDATVFPM